MTTGATARVAERLDRPDAAAPDQVARHPLDQHPSESATAVGGLDVALLLYPVYYCVVNGAIALLIVVRRRAVRHTRWELPAPTA